MSIELKGAAASVAALVAVAAGPLAANAQEVVLKLAESSPASHYISVEASQFFMEKAKELSGGKVGFEHYPAQQLGKATDMLRLAGSGVTDIAYVPVGQLADQLPLSGVGGLPGLFDSACAGTAAIGEISREGILAQEEFDPAGVHVLFAIALASYKALSKTQIDDLDDFSGLKIRTASSAQDETVRELGGVPVRMPAPELYLSMSRGTVDGFLFPFASAKSYDLHTPATTPFALEGVTFGSATSVYVMDQGRWDALPEDVREALTESARQTEEHFCSYADGEEETFRQVLLDEGVAISTVGEAERQAWRSRFEKIWTQWVQTLDGAGRPGTATLDATRAAIEKAQASQ